MVAHHLKKKKNFFSLELFNFSRVYIAFLVFVAAVCCAFVAMVRMRAFKTLKCLISY